MAMEEFNKKKNDLETQKAEAEAMMDGAEVGRLEQELAQLEANKHTYETVTAEVSQDATENQIKQITELGGSEEVLHEKVEAKQEEAKEVEQVLEEKGEEVENNQLQENAPVRLNFKRELTDAEKQQKEERETFYMDQEKRFKAESLKKNIESTQKHRARYLDISERIMKGEINQKNFQSFDQNIYDGETYEDFVRGIKDKTEELTKHIVGVQKELGGLEEELADREEVQNAQVKEAKEVLEEKSEGVVENTEQKKNTGLENQLQSLADKEDRFKRSLNLQNQFLSERMAEYEKFKDAGGDKGSADPFINQGYFDRELNTLHDNINLYQRGLSEINKVRQEVESRIAKGETDNQVYSEFLDRHHSL